MAVESEPRRTITKNMRKSRNRRVYQTAAREDDRRKTPLLTMNMKQNGETQIKMVLLLCRREVIQGALGFAGCVVSIPIIDFCGGLAGRPLSILLFPLGLLPILLGVFCGLFTRGSIVWGIVRQRRMKESLVALVILVLSCVLFLTLTRLPVRPFLLGFRYRIFSVMTADALRMAAMRASALLDAEDPSLWGSGAKASYSVSAKDQAFWAKMREVPGFSRLPRYLVIRSRGGVVEISWGSALAGHWGMRIQRPSVSREFGDAGYWAVEPDIALIMESD